MLRDKPTCCLVNGKVVDNVKKSMADMVSIDRMAEIYCNGGNPLYSGRTPIYSEDEFLPDVKDLSSAVDIMSKCQEVFNTMPAEIRSHYDNNLQKFVKGFNSNDKIFIDTAIKRSRNEFDIANDVNNNANVSTSAVDHSSSTGRGDSNLEKK